MTFLRRLTAATVALAFALGLAGQAAAQDRKMSTIRDAEIENTLKTYGTPVFRAAGLDPDSIRIIIVNDPRLNAFVAGGLNIFLNTGLLMRAETPGEVVGVIAHETGHIAGGHLARLQQALSDARKTSILTFILGAAALIASGGQGNAGMAVLSGGTQIAQQQLLQHTRNQERSADQAAVTFLDRTGQSSRGLYEFMKVLEGQELLITSRQDPYVRTHPLTQDRIAFLRNQVENSPNSDKPFPPEYEEMHQRMRAKLTGFLMPPQRVFNVYRKNDRSLPARYAHAIVYHRLARTDRALKLINGLIEERPNDGYFYELKGQILFEAGRTRQAVEAYEKAVRLVPNSALIRTAAAQAMLETNDPALNSTALAYLNEARRLEEAMPLTWRLLAVAHGRMGDMANSALAVAEEALMLGHPKVAMKQAERAETKFPEGSPGWIRAQDIKREAENLKEILRERG